MWSQAVRMLDEAQRLEQQFFRLQPDPHAAGAWEPPVDVYETEDHWTVLVALPGVPPDRIHYRLEGDCLDVVAERAIPDACTHGAIRRKEVPHGRFARRLRFRVAPRAVSEAIVKDGCLLLTLPKSHP